MTYAAAAPVTRRTLGAALATLLVLACSDIPGVQEQDPVVDPASVLSALIVSDLSAVAGHAAASVGPAAAGPGTVYVSLPPGGFSGGERVVITSRGTAARVADSMVDGGFDPLGIPATSGDTLDVRIELADRVPGGAFMVVVPVRRRPVIVRTEPPPRRRDVPLNASMLLVFSEPIAPASVKNATVWLLQGTVPVPATIGFADSAHVTVVLTPSAPLAGATDYRLMVADSVEDLSGDQLDSAQVIDFTTAPAPTGPVAGLAFTVQPSHIAANAKVRPAVQVSLLDSSGNVVRSATDSVTILVGRQYSYSSSWGRWTVAAVSGVAVFADVAVAQPGANWRLMAMAPPGLPAISDSFAVTVPPHLEFQTPFSATSSALGIVRVAVFDSLGDLDSSLSGNITLTLGSNPTGATLSGTLSQTPTGGIATFTDLHIDRPGAGYTLVTQAGGLVLTGQPFQVTNAAPSAGQVAFVRNGQIHLVNSDGTGLVRLTDGPDDAYPSWSPNGQRIAFSRGTGGPTAFTRDIYIMNADGSNLVQRTFGGYNVEPAWSSDGGTIVYTGMGPGSADVFAIKAVPDGSSPVTIVDWPGWDAQPAWSPNGAQIAYVSDWNAYDFVSDLYLTTPGGTPRTQVTPDTAGTGLAGKQWYQPAWSPDGLHLAVVTCSPGFYTCLRSAIVVMATNGTGAITLAEATGWSHPTWSPDGLTIAFASSGAVGWVRADGSAQGVIITDGGSPAWRP